MLVFGINSNCIFLSLQIFHYFLDNQVNRTADKLPKFEPFYEIIFGLVLFIKN